MFNPQYFPYIDGALPVATPIRCFKGYETVRGISFIYMTYIVVNEKRYELKNVIYSKIGDLSTYIFSYVLGKHNGLFCLSFTLGSNIL